MKEAKSYLKKMLKESDTCVLALSGGPDSMCLLDILLKEKEAKNFKIIAVHINHNTRKACEKEQNFVKKYLKNKEVTLETYKIDSYKKKFTEQEGREKRYKILKEVVKKYHADYLFTAHHGDDLTETILMRIIRGSTLNGYAGMKKESIWDNVTIVRPLIFHTKKEILTYLEENNIPYVIDESNLNDAYLRNKIRHNILPYLENIEPKYHKKFLKFSEALEQTNQFINSQVSEIKNNIIEKNKIKKNKFLSASKFIQEEILKDYICEFYKEDLPHITDRHLNLILAFIKNRKDTGYINLPMKVLFYKNTKYLWLAKEKKTEQYCIKLEDKAILPNGNQVIKLEKYNKKSNNEIHLNSKKITLPLYLTTRTNGLKMEG